MERARNATKRVTAAILIAAVASAFTALAGCGSKADDKFSAETNDEYKEPLVNAVIGSPTGLTVVGPMAAPEGTPREAFVVPAAVSDGGVADGGGGGPADAGGGGGKDGGGGGTDGGGVGTDGGGGGDGGFGDGGSGGDGGVDGGPGGDAFWHFDDCDPTSHFLLDGLSGHANAQHALGAACVSGISGLGVQIRTAKDIIQVPDEPELTVDSHVAVAAWVKPNTVTGNQPIVLKRLQNDTTFSLGIHNGSVEMSVVSTKGQTFISRAPIAAGTFSHVAGMYDGTFVFLFINGQQMGQVFVGGALHDVFAPIRIGATTQTQHFDGLIDEVFLSTRAISKDQLTALSCIHRSSTLTVNPPTSGVVAPNTPVHYDVSVTNNDIGACEPEKYQGFISPPDTTISGSFNPSFFGGVVPGATATFGADVTASDEAEPGVHAIPFVVDAFSFSPSFSFEAHPGQLTLELSAPTGCIVRTARELMITNTGVVDDPVRTTGSGVWTFGHLIREMARTPADGPALASRLFQLSLTDQTVNGFTVAARPAMQQTLLDIWPKTATGELDLDRSPMTLQAIVNRIDVRDLSTGSAGEGRFVFGVNGQFSEFPQNFTVILEYNLPGTTPQDVLDWANRWHALSTHPFPSEEYNVALEAITRLFADRNAQPGNANGSALAELRTNENVLSPFGQWELRGFVLSPTSGFFEETTVKETPDLSFNGTGLLANLVNQNAAAIEAVLPGANGNTIPAQIAGKNFLAGSVFNDLIRWSAPGIVDPDARFHQSLNTCNGCHGPETNTTFLMVNPRFPGTEATLSPFMTGTTVIDPFTGQSRSLNDLARRNADLKSLVCAASGARKASLATAKAASPKARAVTNGR